MREWDLEFPLIEAIFTEYWELDNGDIGEYRELAVLLRPLVLTRNNLKQLLNHHRSQALIESTDKLVLRGVWRPFNDA